VDEATQQLIISVESLKLKVKALEDAIVNLTGFTKLTGEDRVVFERKVEPEIKPVTETVKVEA
jgi:hypothetical protein